MCEIQFPNGASNMYSFLSFGCLVRCVVSLPARSFSYSALL